MDKASLIRGLVNSRVFIYKSSYGEKQWVVYENLYEEGDEVKKQIGRFGSEKNARVFAAAFRDELTKYFEAALTVTVDLTVTRPIADTVTKKLWPPSIATDPSPTRGHASRTPADEEAF